MKVQRYDKAYIVDYQKTPEGYMTVDVPITRPGVFPYMRGDGTTVMEAKLPADIFHADTIRSAKSKPVTDNHPHEPVTLANYAKYARGMSHTDARAEDDLLKVSVTITDAALIQKIESGAQREISIGFLSDVVKESGTYNGDNYDFAQRNIEINHIAIVERGRAGSSVAIRNDSDGWQIDEIGGKDTMPTYKIDGKEYEVDSAVKSFIEALTAKVDAADVKLKNVDKLEGERDAEKARADQAEADLDEAKKNQLSEDEMMKAVEERVTLMDSARIFLGDEFDFTGKSAREIKEAVIGKVQPDFKADGRSDDYVNAFFDATAQKAKKDGFSSTGNRSMFTSPSNNYSKDEGIDKKRADRLSMKKK